MGQKNVIRQKTNDIGVMFKFAYLHAVNQFHHLALSVPVHYAKMKE